jgi:hypothetical protein
MVGGVARTGLISLTRMMSVLMLVGPAALAQNPFGLSAGNLPQASLVPDKPKSQETQAKSQDTASVAGSQNEQAGEGQKADNGSKSKLHFRLGAITVSAAYVHLPNNFFYEYPLYTPFYPCLCALPLAAAPFFYDPVYAAYGSYGSGFAYDSGKGQVKLTAEPKTAEVYLDGAYAGLAGKLKSLWLQPGAYDLTLAAPDRAEFHQRIYVLSGKTVKIRATLLTQSLQEKTKATSEKQP